jgi:hypothetical protein
MHVKSTAPASLPPFSHVVLPMEADRCAITGCTVLLSTFITFIYKVLTVAAASESILSLFILCTYLPTYRTIVSTLTDQLIANRRKDAAPKPSPKKVVKSVSNTDRSVAASRAKRSAAMDKKRGMRQDSKPSAMQVDNEVSKQVKKTATARAKKPATAQGSVKVVMAKTTNRRERREVHKAGATARKVNTGGRERVEATPSLTRPPSKKVVTAAVNAMEQKGFSIPDGMQMVISFAPAPGAAVAPPQQKKNPRNAPKNSPQPKAKNDTGAQSNTGGNRRRSAGRGRGRANGNGNGNN